MTEWRIYYSDGTTFDSTRGEPHQAPTTGFLCAVGYDQDGTRYIQNGWNFYRWDRETRTWWGMDEYGLFDRLRNNMEIYAFKEGRTVSKLFWQDVMNRAHKDPDFPMR